MATTVDVIILGTGSAAQNVAYGCRAAGWSVVVVDSRLLGEPARCVDVTRRKC
jgi:glutathione reductase (NADPH)